MSRSKVRSFTVAPSSPGGRAFFVEARSRLQLQRRLFDALRCSEEVSWELVSALWADKPVFVLDIGVSLIPGCFEGVSYQWMGASRGFGA